MRHGDRYLPLRCPEDDCAVPRLLASAESLWAEGRMHPAIAAAEQAVSAAHPLPDCAVAAQLQAAVYFSHVRHTARSRELLCGARTAVRRTERADLEAALTLVRAYVTAAAGECSAALGLAESGLRQERSVGLRSWVPLGHVTLAASALRGGDLPTALDYAAELMQDAVFHRGMFPAGQSGWVIVQTVEAHKGQEPAVALAAELIGLESSLHQLLSAEPAAAAWLVRLLMAAGEKQPAVRCLRTAQRLAAGNPRFRTLKAAAQHADGVFHDDPDLLRRAAEAHLDPWARASAAEDLGTVLVRRSAGRAEAEAAFERAVSLYAEVGATRDSLRARQRRRSARDPAAAPAGWAGPGLPASAMPLLTDTEFAVARLVAQGLTNTQAANQLFLSPHTVAFHLRKIFRKLGVRSRVHLAGAWGALESELRAEGGPAA